MILKVQSNIDRDQTWQTFLETTNISARVSQSLCQTKYLCSFCQSWIELLVVKQNLNNSYQF